MAEQENDSAFIALKALFYLLIIKHKNQFIMKALFFSLALVFSLTTVKAQEAAKEKAPAPNTLANQFNDLMTNSNSYQGHKVIKIGSINSFWKTVQDSVKVKDQALSKARLEAKNKLDEAQANIQDQEKQILALKEESAQKDLEVQRSASISVLGLYVEKQNYAIINTIIIIALLILLAVIFLQYKSSRKVTVEKQRAYDEIDQEFNEYKKSAREKELKVKRELQTEMNRVEELNQQIASLKKQPQV